MATLKTLNGMADANIKTVNGVARTSVKTFNGIATIPPWITLSSGDWSQDTANFTLGTGTVAWASGSNKHVRTSTSLIASSTDFDWELVAASFGTVNGPKIGFFDNVAAGNVTFPTTADILTILANGGGGPGIFKGYGSLDTSGSRSAGWLSAKTILISRRTTTYKLYLDAVLEHTWTSPTTAPAMGFYIAVETGNAFSFSGVRYRSGSGLP